ncbi:MAG: outer membrane beta-barrel domain-containing protein [Pseudomonadota bacterium]
MESRLLVLLLAVAASLAVAPALAQTVDINGVPVVVDPDLDRRDVRQPRIDSENFEIGVHGGLMSIEDFGTNSSVAVRFTYHIAGGFFAEAAYGQSEGGTTSFERLSGSAPLLTDEEREFTYYDLSFGYDILPGEVFIGSSRAFNTALYLLAGAGSTTFGGDDRFTITVGAGVRFLMTDAFAVHLDVRDRLFDIDLLGEDKTAHNFDTTLGFSFFF